MRKRFGDRLRAYWWLWALVVGVAVVLNELFDREVAGDKNGHPAGDLLVAIVVVLIALFGWDLVTRKSRST
jgi:drug/metabolite transporter (DMT)-like permease